MVKTRSWRAALIAVAMIAAPMYALAEPSAPPNVYHSLDSAQGRPARTIEGTIEAVDYAGGSLVVRGHTGTRTIALVPNTAIYRHGQYATLSDLRRGQLVQVTVFQVGDRLVAKTITLKS